MNPQELFLKLVAHLRALQIIAQAAHHNIKGSLFFQDHDALGDFYEALQGEYDRAAEKYVSLYGAYDINRVMQLVLAAMQGAPSGEVKENKEYFTALLSKEKEVSSMVDMLVRQGNFSEGTKNLLADIGTVSEGRQYLIKQRIK